MRYQYDQMSLSFRDREKQAAELQNKLLLFESQISSMIKNEVDGQKIAETAFQVVHNVAELVQAYNEGDLTIMKERLKGFADMDVLQRKKEQTLGKIEEVETQLTAQMKNLEHAALALEAKREEVKKKEEKKKEEPPTPTNDLPAGVEEIVMPGSAGAFEMNTE